jgi:protein-tyrosine phosphatase/arsenate reductase
MYPSIENYCRQLITEFDQIPEARKLILQKISGYIQQQISAGKPVQLVYICTHNSRRSHYGQVWAKVAASFYHTPNTESFSGGTEATAFNPNAIYALQQLGMHITPHDPHASNPHYTVRFGDSEQTTCFSKRYDDAANPQQGFAAIMTCSDADENCPFIPGAAIRIATPYDDPKAFDHTPQQESKYAERCRQIALETLYAFSLVKNKN